ncbi:hypothetical protein ACEZCY_13965 [Streptacidiphilus sp. N1-12]|uniref:Helix-turn-helix domain-containing protein n=2 Tax=Streptacidiphilus alkalitolerans TaxID=3342712 RepID=A0ABV6V9L1_9ACTN
MARRHGLILSSIWDDADFTDLLGEGEQRLYAFLLSQPNLNHAGLLPLTLKRWARKAKGLTVDLLQQRLDVLEQRRFIVMDADTEELLIRSFIRNDGVYRMPRVMGAAVSGAQEISSHKLRRALLAEMPRIPLEELSDAAGPKGPSVRAQVQEHIEVLCRTIAVPLPNPSAAPSAWPEQASPNPSATPGDTPRQPFPKGSAGVADTPDTAPADTPGEPPAQPSTHVRAEAHARVAPALSPALSPPPSSSPPPPDPAVVQPSTPAEGGGGGEDPTEQAIEFLEQLPQPWTLGRVTAKAYAPNLIARAAERHWELDAALAAELTKDPGGIRSYREVLRSRIEDLAYRQRPALPLANQKPCATCGTTERRLADNGICPPCIKGDSGAQPRTLMPAGFRQAIRPDAAPSTEQE